MLENAILQCIMSKHILHLVFAIKCRYDSNKKNKHIPGFFVELLWPGCQFVENCAVWMKLKSLQIHLPPLIAYPPSCINAHILHMIAHQRISSDIIFSTAFFLHKMKHISERVGRQRAFNLSQKLDIGVKRIDTNIYGTQGKASLGLIKI